MIKKRALQHLQQYSLILILLLAVAVQGGAQLFPDEGSQEVAWSLEDIRLKLPLSTEIKRGGTGIYTAFDQNGNISGKFILSHEFSQTRAYGGPVPMLIFLSAHDTISGISLLENNESEEFLEYIYDQGLLDKWNNTHLNAAGQINCDAVTGATETSNAIIKDMQLISADFGNKKQAESPNSRIKIMNGILFFLMLLASLIMLYSRKFKRYRSLYLIVLVIVMGIVLNKMLSTSFIHNIMVSGLPWKTNWQQLAILLLAVLLPLIGKRQYFCNYLCPMGALQELMSALRSGKKHQPAHIKIKGISLSEISLTLLWAALLTGFSPELSKLEPFMFFSFRVIGWAMIAFGIIVLILSLFFKRPWCALCPTGCLLKKLEPVKTKNTQINAKQ